MQEPHSVFSVLQPCGSNFWKEQVKEPAQQIDGAKTAGNCSYLTHSLALPGSDVGISSFSVVSADSCFPGESVIAGLCLLGRVLPGGRGGRRAGGTGSGSGGDRHGCPPALTPRFSSGSGRASLSPSAAPSPCRGFSPPVRTVSPSRLCPGRS